MATDLTWLTKMFVGTPLEGLISKPNDSESELARMQAEQALASTPQMEAQARKAGFKTYQQLLEFQRQKQKRRDPSTVAGGESLKEKAWALHPGGMFDKVTEALKGANNKD